MNTKIDAGRQFRTLNHAPSPAFRFPLPETHEHYRLKEFLRNLIVAAQNVAMVITYLVIGVGLPVVLGLLVFLSTEEGPYCMDCVNLNGRFYPTYSFWMALFLCGGGLMALLLGCRSLIRRLWTRPDNRYHLIRAR